MTNSQITDTAAAMDRRRPPTPWAVHVSVLRAHLGLILAAVALAVGGAVVYLVKAPHRYTAHAQLLVSVDDGSQPMFDDLPLLRSSSEPGRPVQTIAWLAMSNRVAGYASVALGGKPSATWIAANVVAQPVASADVVDITVTASNPAQAAAVANAVAAGVKTARAADLNPTLNQLIGQLQSQLRSSKVLSDVATQSALQLHALQQMRMTGDPSVQVLQRATAPASASWPDPPIVIGAAALVGLLIGVLGAFALESRRPRLRNEGHLRRRNTGPLIASIPSSKSRRPFAKRRRGPLVPEQLSADTAEQVRTLSHRLVGRHCVLVTGASRSEGRTSLALALAHAAALAGRETILLELDVRAPALANTLGTQPYASVQSVLDDVSKLEEALVWLPSLPPLLGVLPAGAAPTTLADLPQPGQLVELIHKARALADLVIIDAGPLGSVGDVVPLIAAVDFTLLVASPGKTSLDALTQVAAELDGADTATVIIGQRAVRIDRRFGLAFGAAPA